MGFVRDCSRKVIRFLTRATAVETERLGWMWNSTQMEFPKGKRRQGIWPLSPNPIRPASALNDPLTASPTVCRLQRPVWKPTVASALGFFLSLRVTFQSRARKTCQLTPHTGPPPPAVWWTQRGKTEGVQKPENRTQGRHAVWGKDKGTQRPRVAKTEFWPERHSLSPIVRTQTGKAKNEGHPHNMACALQHVGVVKDKAGQWLRIKGAQRKWQLKWNVCFCTGAWIREVFYCCSL